VIDDRVCECCPTAAALTSEGPIVAFRDRSQDEIRDIAVSRLVDGRWSEPAAVHRDNWQINACPVNGPALGASGRDVAVAWFTVAEDLGHVFVAFSSDAGRTFGAPVRVDDVSALGRVDVELLPDGAAIVSWIEVADKRSEFRIRRVGSTDSDLSVFFTISGTANNRIDYQRLRGNATIRSGTTSVSITLRPIDDTISEPDETAILTLSPDANYIIGSPNTATVTIHSNE